MNSTKTILLLIGLLLYVPIFAQVEKDKEYFLSLKEAVELGLENNYTSKSATLDVEKALKQRWEIIAQGLPQLSATGSYQNNLKQTLTPLPAEFMGGEPGTFVAVPFSPRHSVSATATWNQIIFDGSYIVGVQSARTLLQISENAKVKTNQQVREAIINAYGNVLLAEENASIMSKNVENVQKNLDDTRATYENGLAEQEDVEQLEITLLGLQNNLNRAVRMLDIAYELLNLTLGIPIETSVSLTQEIDQLTQESLDLALLHQQVPVEKNIDFRIAANNAESAEIYVKLEKSKALPSLNGFVNYGVSGFGQEFDFFDSGQPYYNNSIMGLSLNIPIFSSGMRGARTQQMKIELDQALLQLEQTKNDVKLQTKSARNDYEFSIENYQNQKRNLELARRIEQKNQIKFFEGLASSFELSEAQRQLYAAQQEYLQSMLDVINTKVALENLLDTTSYEEK